MQQTITERIRRLDPDTLAAMLRRRAFS